MGRIQPHNIPRWLLLIDFLYGHEYEAILNYSIDGKGFILPDGTQVRAGSVIFLVGVGSLVCWKLWDYWNGGGEDDSPDRGDKPPNPPDNSSRISFSKSPTKRTKDFLASFLEEEFVHDFEDFEDEDPALIQGKYFGPDSPIEDKASEDNSPLTSEYSGKSQSESARQYLADNSASYSADEDGGCLTSDVEELPFDDFSVTSNGKRNVKRRRRTQEADRSLSSTPSKSPYRFTPSKDPYEDHSGRNILHSNRFHPYGRGGGGGGGGVTASHEDISSSDTSPRGHPSHLEETLKQTRQTYPPPLERLQGDGSETPDSEEFKTQKIQGTSSSTKGRTLYANCNSDEEWTDDARFQPDGEEEELLKLQDERRQSRELSLAEMMARFRQKSSRRSSLSRDNSVSSRLSDFLRRDDSICSNLSDFAYSECSELSLELSIKDDSIANHTISSLADIEDELNTLKSSVLEIDEEFVKFASRPNPYLLKTTFSDYSLDSSDSRPGSALDLITYRRPRTLSRNFSESEDIPSDYINVQSKTDASSSTGSDRIDRIHLRRTRRGSGRIPIKNLHSLQGSEAEMSLEWDSPQHGWTSSKRMLLKLSRRRSSTDSKLSTQDDVLPSLEWDNDGCLKQYDEENNIKEDTFGEFGLNEKQLDRYKFLPDHSSLELDLEEELQSPKDSTAAFVGYKTLASPLTSSVSFHLGDGEDQGILYPPFNTSKLPEESPPLQTGEVQDIDKPSKTSPPSSLPLELISEVRSNPMTTSVDSAIHSAPGSRSGSSSPLPHLLTQSMMSSGIATSWSEITSSATPDSESGNTSAGSDKLKRETFSYEHGYKLRRFWSSEESGYVEEEGGLESSVNNLSPVHEIREKETPQHHQTCNENLNSFQTLEDNSILSCEINDNTANNNLIMGNSSSNSHLNDSTSETIDALSNTVRRNFQAIGEKMDIISYALSEWNGSTKRAQTIRKGYSAIPEELDLSSLRRIRGDNYCGIRAVLFQLLTSGLAIPSGYQVYNRLISEINRGASWLRDYTFGRRIVCSKDQVIIGFKNCLDALDKLTLDLIGCENRENLLSSRLNSDSHLDVQICEAAKLHMLACSLDLFREEVQGKHVPLFAMIMFARETSTNPKEFLLNHLNPVGDSAGLEQIEMFLLGYSLRVTLQVVRPSSFGCEDFICFYPDENIGVWPEVTLVAEDDRHYNVLVK